MIYIMHPQQDEILGYITPDNYWEDEHHHGLDGVHFIQFGTYADSEEAQHLTDRCRLIAQGSSGVWQEFIAHQISTRTGRKLKIVATGAEMELDGLKIIYPQTFTGATLEYCLSIATSDTDWQSGIVDHASFQTQTFEQHLGGYAFLLRIANYYDRELRFRIEVSGNRFVGRYIDMVERVGADKRKEIVAGSNLISIDRTFHSKDVITGLICRGPEREDGSRLEIRVTDDEAFQRWNRNNNHIWDVYEPESTDAEMTEERLRSLGTTELKKRINAVVEYEIEAAVLEGDEDEEDDDVQLGDTLRIKDENFEPPLYAESRAIFVKQRIGRGDLQKTYTIGEITELEEDEVLLNARKAQARYGTKILRSPLPPPIQKAIWFQTNPEEPDKLEIPHVPDMSSQTWKPASAKTAGEIGGIELNKQYNGVSWSEEEGIVVDRTDELVRTIVNATEGISIEARKTLTEAFNKVLYIDVDGNLKFKGDLEGAGGSFSGALSSGDGASKITIDNGYVRGNDRTLFSVFSVLPEMHDKESLDYAFGKNYTHRLDIPVSTGNYSPGDFIEVTVPIVDPTTLGITKVLGVFVQSEAKEWYVYERKDSRAFTQGELSSLTIRISPHYAYSSTGTIVPISIQVIGTR